MIDPCGNGYTVDLAMGRPHTDRRYGAPRNPRAGFASADLSRTLRS